MRALKLDSTREVDFGTRPGTEPSIVTKGSTAKSLVNKSPLFLDLSTNTERALPGGVVVTFPFETSPERAKALLASEGLSNAKPLVGSQVWLVESAGGQAALDLANRLQESGKFRAAEPNWWSRRSTK